MLKVIVHYENDLVIALTKIDEIEINLNLLEGNYFITDDAPVFENPMRALRVNTQTNPPSVSCPPEILEQVMLPINRSKAVRWKKIQLASVDWTQVILTAVDRKVIMGLTLTEPEKDVILAEWQIAGSPEV